MLDSYTHLDNEKDHKQKHLHMGKSSDKDKNRHGMDNLQKQRGLVIEVKAIFGRGDEEGKRWPLSIPPTE